ncbi:TnsD family Tn7-like transposition protein [Ningiella sp. W23]|uniref:TnsD family Tn7-like transposition protein n=1 Tax=Ningiella sp. W23 TaxID=3023715 RepID=UPI0037564DB2
MRYSLHLNSLNFFKDELLYSFLARLAVHLSLESPKALIEAVFDSRSTAATIAIPGHLQKLYSSGCLPPRYTIDQIIHQHTLFPLVSSFIRPELRVELLSNMRNGNASRLFVRSGLAANRLPKLTFLRYCPLCLLDQKNKFGIGHWQRIHQIVAVQHCAIHRCKLLGLKGEQLGYERHTFHPLRIKSCDQVPHYEIGEHEAIVEAKCRELLNQGEPITPTFHQWTNYYLELAQTAECRKGKYIKFEPIEELVKQRWPEAFLSKNGLVNTKSSSSWLHSIFRKHRKSFSYLEHIVVNGAIKGPDFSIVECVKQASNMAKETETIYCEGTRKTSARSTHDMAEWQNLLALNGPKSARKLRPNLYARLYREDRSRLLDANNQFKVARTHNSSRINWKQRDKKAAKSLLKIIDDFDAHLSFRRLTKRFLIYRLPRSASIEKKPTKYVLTHALLEKYSESIFEFQIRRITNTILTSDHHSRYKRWWLLRNSGLSEQRLTKEVRIFIDKILPSEFFTLELTNTQRNSYEQ